MHFFLLCRSFKLFFAYFSSIYCIRMNTRAHVFGNNLCVALWWSITKKPTLNYIFFKICINNWSLMNMIFKYLYDGYGFRLRIQQKNTLYVVFSMLAMTHTFKQHRPYILSRSHLLSSIYKISSCHPWSCFSVQISWITISENS